MDNLINDFLFPIFFLTSVLFIITFFRSLIALKNTKTISGDLSPYYSPNDVERTTRYYVPVKYQNVAPSEDDEPGRKYIASAKNKLMPLFLKEAFKYGGDDNKYYLVLADSGMGKTTFLINLYIAYKNSRYSPFSSSPKYDIKLFPLGQANILEDIAEVKDKKNTILLLDAFDEDLAAVADYRKRLDTILQTVHQFREIVITCRTQFFPSRAEVPYETGYYSFGEQGEYKFQKLYLSVFDDKAINKYLRKRFSFWQWRKRSKAKHIVQKSPNLVVRPMLLSHIEELVETDKAYEFSFEVYEAMIEKWLEREAKKPHIARKFGSEDTFKKLLYRFSERLARHLYEKRGEYGGYFLPRGVPFEEGLLSIAYIEGQESKMLALNEQIGKTKSLLNRNATGDYKFSHKSILEYFLARKFFNDINFYPRFDFMGMDAVQGFFKELLIAELRTLKGQFSTNNDDNKTISLEKLQFTDLEKIQYLKIKGYHQFQVQMLANCTSLKTLVLIEPLFDISVYTLYFWLYYLELQELRKRLELRELLERLERLELRELQELRERLELRERREERLERRELRELLERLELLELLELREIGGIFASKIRKEEQTLLDSLKQANEQFKHIRLLQEKLPNCKIWY